MQHRMTKSGTGGGHLLLALGTEEDMAFTVRPRVVPQKVLELSGCQSGARYTDTLTVQVRSWNCNWFESLEGMAERRGK